MGRRNLFYIISIVLWLLVIVQGGFFINAYGIATMFLGIGLLTKWIQLKKEFIKKLKQKNQRLVELGFGMLVILTFISGARYPFDQEWLSRCIYVMFAWLLYTCFAFIEKKDAEKLGAQLRYLMYVEAIFCIIAYVGRNFLSTMKNARFMGTFQYANATALFIGAGIFLQTVLDTSEKKDWKYLSFFCMVVMATTFSAGGLLCYGAACILCGILVKNKKLKGKSFLGLLEFFCAIFMAMLWYWTRFRLEHRLVTVVMILTTVALSIFFGYKREKLNESVEKLLDTQQEGKRKKRRLFIGVVGGSFFCVAVLLFAFFFGHRVMGTGLERLQQMQDAIRVILENPFSGLGVSKWGDYIKGEKEITYYASMVHCSYLHLGVELGIFAVIIEGIMIYAYLFANPKGKEQKTFQIAEFVFLLHFTIDFTMFFAGILVVMGVARCCLFQWGANL